MKEMFKTMVEHPIASAFVLWCATGAAMLVLANLPSLITINVSRPEVKADA